MAELKSFPFPNGAEYGYWEYRPEGATKLLIFLHGHGERGDGHLPDLNKVLNIGIPKMIKAGTWQNADPFNQFIIVAPQYKVESNYTYPGTLDSFITKMCAKYTIDKSTSVYLVGISGGAISIGKFINEFHYPKAAVIISGDMNNVNVSATLGTKLWFVHGEDDTTVKIDSARNFYKKYNESNPPIPAKFDALPNYSHESGVWDRAVSKPKYYKWMLE